MYAIYMENYIINVIISFNVLYINYSSHINLCNIYFILMHYGYLS